MMIQPETYLPSQRYVPILPLSVQLISDHADRHPVQALDVADTTRMRVVPPHQLQLKISYLVDTQAIRAALRPGDVVGTVGRLVGFEAEVGTLEWLGELLRGLQIERQCG